MLTEQRNPKSDALDQMTTLQVLQTMNDEDATVAAAVRGALPQIAALVDVTAERLSSGGRLIYVGAGTSGRLGVLDAVECVPTFSTSPDVVQAIIAGGEGAMFKAVEGAEDDHEAGAAAITQAGVREFDVVVGIAASGRTPFVLGAVQRAAQLGAVTGGIACNVPAPLLDAVQHPVPLLVGPEVLTGSTRLKAGTAQKLALNMMSTTTMVRLGKVYGNLMVDVKVTNAKLAGRARRIVCEVTGVSEDDAAALLTQTDNEVKTAIVMALTGATAADARARITQHGGHLRRIIS